MVSGFLFTFSAFFKKTFEISVSDEDKKARAKATSPVFLVQLKDADLLESTHARFMVKVNGNPMPKVEL